MADDKPLALRPDESAAIETYLSPAALVAQVELIQQTMELVMKNGEHYGTIPGCGDKPALLKAGAEKLGLIFRLAPEFKVEQNDLGGGHRDYYVECRLVSTTSGQTMGMGVGSCSTMETKYRYRQAERLCPTCGKPAIIKGRAEYGGGWLCYGKKGGCGAKFADGDPAIEGQQVGRTENPDIADTYNTVLKMAKKRAHVDAMLTTTAASDIFTQDIEDLPATVAPVAARASAEQVALIERIGKGHEAEVFNFIDSRFGPVMDGDNPKLNDKGDPTGKSLSDLTPDEASTVIDWLKAGRETVISAPAEPEGACEQRRADICRDCKDECTDPRGKAEGPGF